LSVVDLVCILPHEHSPQDNTATTTSAAAMVSKRGASGAVPSATAAAIATDPLSYLIDFREHDVPYGVRASIDLDLRVGAWYKVSIICCCIKS